MNDNAFDEALRRVAADEKLPYAGEAWTRMAARLDAHSSGKGRGLVIPLPVIRWAAAAAVIVLALAAGWWLRDAVAPSTDGYSARSVAGMPVDTDQQLNTEGLRANETVTAQPTQRAASRSSLDASHTTEAGPARVARNYRRAFTPASGGKATVANTPAAAIAATLPANEAPASPPVQPSVIATPPPVVTPAPRRQAQDQFAFIDPDEALKPAQRTGFDVAGGYGYGGDVPAFSVGVSVRRSVSSRLQVEGALALVGTTPDPIGSTTKADNLAATPGNSSEPTFVGTSTQGGAAAQQAAAAKAEYEDLRSRQIYVQAAPVMMYRVLGGLSAGGGLDAQRRVSANSAAREEVLNSFNGVSLPALPEWDFGLALRADYKVTKGMRLGVQYRESVRAMAADGRTTEGRNYWLLQAGFRIR